MTATGSITVDGRTEPVTGEAWFDHQWGDFIAVGGGGWDWFAVNLADGTDLTLSLVRERGRLVPARLRDARRRGRTHDAPAARRRSRVETTGRWQSPATGADYPAGWRIRIPAEGLEIDLTPTVADQELDTRASTGVVYWEGSQHVAATRNGTRLGGEAYVELTGYAPVAPAAPRARRVAGRGRAGGVSALSIADGRRQGLGDASGSVTPLAVATATICASTAERPARSRIIALADCLYAVVFVTDWTSASTAVSWMPL